MLVSDAKVDPVQSVPALGLQPARALVVIGIGAFLALAAGFRWLGVGRDYLEYYLFYDTVTVYFGTGYSRFEPGYEASAWIAANIFNLSFPMFFFVMAAMAISLKFWLIWKNCRSPIFACVVYSLLFFPIHEYTQIRAAVALGLVYLGVHLMLRKKYLWAAAAAAAAFTFHASSLIVVLVAIAAYIVDWRIIIAALIPFSLAAIFYYQLIGALVATYFSAFNPLIQKYVGNENNAVTANIFSGSNIAYMLTLVVGAAIGWLHRGRYHSTFFIIAAAGIPALVIFRDSPVLALRTSEMLLVASIFLAFRDKAQGISLLPQAIMFASGVWFTYRAWIEGTFGG